MELHLGAGRTDLYLSWRHGDQIQHIVLEMKLRHGSRQTTIDAALPQITAYMDRCGTDEGHLLLFDRGKATWDEKIFREDVTHEGRRIQVWGM